MSQPTNVIFQRPFKYRFRQKFDNYTLDDIDKQLDNKEVKDIKVDTKMFILKPFYRGWLLKAWDMLIRHK